MSNFEHCLKYTALGNSIAFGVGASFNVNDPEHHGYGYVYYFRDFLASRYSCVDLKNRAVPGSTSGDLLHQLQTDPATREAVKEADLMTINIGGNDLLNCLGAQIIPVCLGTAVANFARNWALMMKEIRENIFFDAEIYVSALYNPFRGDDPNFNMIEPFIQQINNVIKANSWIYHYKVVDVHADFLGQFTGTNTWKVCIWTHFCEVPVSPNLPNPHPADSGHLEIARLHELVYLKHHPHKLHRDESSDRHHHHHHHHPHPPHPPHLPYPPHPLYDESNDE